MNLELQINKLEEELRSLFEFENSGHDLYHLKRVMNLASHIQEKEGGDKTVICISAFLHDVHRIIENETGKHCSPKDSLSRIEKIIDNVDIELDDYRREKVLNCIKYHEEYDFTKEGKTVEGIETLILQDADNLDAMGAMGIARAFTYGGAAKMLMWNPEISINNGNYDETTKELSTIHHFYNKLLKLKDNMNTDTAKQMALQRQEFMENFLNQFFMEWEGKL